MTFVPGIAGGQLQADGTVRIPLTQGQFATVDIADYDKVRDYKWRAKHDRNTFYAKTSTRKSSGKETSVRMHRLILGVPEGVDHEDGNGLNNSRSNLRPSNESQNQGNQHVTRSASGLKGVSWNKQKSKWRAQIMINQRKTYLGSFTDQIEAARAYDAAARKTFGAFACLNFPEPSEQGISPDTEINLDPPA